MSIVEDIPSLCREQMRHTHVFFSLDDDWLFISNERVSKNFERPSVEHRCCKMVITYDSAGGDIIHPEHLLSRLSRLRESKGT